MLRRLEEDTSIIALFDTDRTNYTARCPGRSCISRMSDVIRSTKRWCDVTSLDPSDGRVLDEVRGAVAAVAHTTIDANQDITIRTIFCDYTRPVERTVDGINLCAAF